ncbi:DUF2306 domain-containing protein [Nonomuraea mesophila]|uniref:DUF2306 domain-containing protein n=1 Tax=Nonomuraea mesophila TaxID=2530382 RepID=A0A4R5FXQ3_9ACTN|nr:DUF2306 domain-containing protein [Nonomuraea mesophila]TDE60323.1 DUF2306 domain-containing protein [Nonomuraea mesophila]
MTTQIPEQAPPTTRPRRKRRKSPWWSLPLAVITLAILAYMLEAYVPPDIRTSRADMHGDNVRYALLLGHILFGAIATVTGLLQLWAGLRNRFPRVHRWTGRVYFYAGIFPSMILAVPVSIMSESGVSNVAALDAMLVMWAITGVAGLRAARSRRFADHRIWMIRNYSVTLAILASRPWGLIMTLLVTAQADGPAYEGNSVAIIHDIASSGAWTALLVNVVLAEIYVQRKYMGRGRKLAPAGAGR